jgi:hypothetical protein
MTRTLMTTLASAFRRMALPLATYYIVTLVLPLANGADWSDAVFMKHAFVVLAVPPAGIALASVAGHVARALAGIAGIGAG